MLPSHGVIMAAKIERLTPEQQARIPEFVEYWTKVGLSTEPADRPRAEAAIAAMYAGSNLPPPQAIVWCGSPLSLALARALALDNKMNEAVAADRLGHIAHTIWASARMSGREASPVAAGYCFSNHVGYKVLMSVQQGVRSAVSESVWSDVRERIADGVWENISDSVSIWDDVRGTWSGCSSAVLGAAVTDQIDGQHDAGLLAVYRFFSDVLGLQTVTEQLAGFWELAQSAGVVLPHQNICWISERRRMLKLDEDGFLHSLSGPAVSYPDGFNIYAVHGERVPAFVIERPHEITIQKIEAEPDAELRRLMIDRYRIGEEISGTAAFIRDAGGKSPRRS
jgi:hypothetical protein